MGTFKQHKHLMQEDPVRALLGYPKASVWKFSNGDEPGGAILLNVFDTGNDTWAVAIDSDDNVIVGGNIVLTGGGSNQGVWKLDKGICWIAFVYNVWVQARGIAIDDKNNAYIAHYYGTTGRASKHNRFGFLLWQYLALGVRYGVAVDASYNTYWAGAAGANKSSYKLWPDGEMAWDFYTGTTSHGVVVDDAGNSYYASGRIGERSVWKVDSAGSEVWTFDTLGVARGIALDADGNVYVVGASVGNVSVRKLNNAGEWQWSFNTGGTAWGIAIEDAQWISLDKYKKSPWKKEADAYDEGDVPAPETYASRNKKAAEWTEWLEHALSVPRRCDKVKVWARTEIETDDHLEVEVYYSGAWHGCIDTAGDFQSEWKEGSFTAVLVEKVRTRLKCSTGEDIVWHRVYEVMLHRTLNIYVAGDRVGTASVWKLNEEGNLVWTIDTGDDTKGVALDSLGNVLVVGSRVWPPP